MKLRDTFASKVAVAALALGLAQSGTALAQETSHVGNADTAPLSAVQTPLPKNPAPLTADQNHQQNIFSTQSYTFEPLVPLSVIAGLSVLLAAASVMAGRGSIKGIGLRAGFSGVVLMTLLNPEILKQDHAKLPTTVAIVVDKSPSQLLDGRDKMTDAAYGALVHQLAGIEGIEVRTIEAGAAKDGVPADGTRLFAALDTLRDVPHNQLGAIFMLTDGQVHDITAGHYAGGNGAPLHVLISGHEGERDRRIVIDSAPHFGLVNKDQKIKFHVLDEGAPAGPDGKIRVTVTNEGKELWTNSVTPGETVEVTVAVPHAGTNLIELKAETLPGELTDVNNRVVATIEGIREHLSVLMVSGAPNPNVRLFRNLFKSDPDIDFVDFNMLRTPEQDDAVPIKELAVTPFPANELFTKGLGKFNLIVFDHYEDRGLLPKPYFNYIANHVKEGGSLLVISGPEYASMGSLSQTPLGAILPAVPTGGVTEAAYLPLVSGPGERHPVTRDLNGISSVPGTDQPHWGRWVRLIDSDAPPQDVVMRGAGNKPLLVLNHEAKGRVAMLLSDSAWLWTRGFENGGPSAALLRNLSHWLLKDPALDEESLHMSRQGGKLVIERQTMADKSQPVTVHTPSGKTLTVTPEAAGPGLWRAVIPADELGSYSAEQEGGSQMLTATISVDTSDPKEFANTISTPDLLKPVVDESGGGIARMVDKKGVLSVPHVVARQDNEAMKGSDWLGIHMSGASAVKNVSRTPLFPPLLAMFAAIVMLGGAFYREAENPLFRKGTASKDPTPGPGGPSI